MKTNQLKQSWKAAALLLGSGVGIGLTVSAEASIPQGHFVGRIHRAAQRANFEVDLHIKTVGDVTYAVQFERGTGVQANNEFGLLMQVIELESGQLAFSRMFIDGSMPVLRTNSQYMMTGERIPLPVAGGTIQAINMNFNATDGEPAYSYQAVRAYPHARQSWVDFNFAHPFFGRADGIYSGNAVGEVDSTSMRFNVASADASAIPCGLSSGRIEILQYAPGLAGARLINPDLAREGGYSVARSLFGVVIPLRQSNFVEAYNVVKFITFADEACTPETGLAPGSAVSTRVITFHERRAS